MEIRKHDAERLSEVAGHLSATTPDRPVEGIDRDDAEALRLVVAYEREHGRSLDHPGATLAAARMLDNHAHADDGPYDMATFMVSDLSVQRDAAAVLAAADLWASQKVEPKGVLGDDRDIIDMVVKEDLQNDPDVKADWLAMSEGRFGDVSPMSEYLLRESIRDHAGLEEGASDWLYRNERRDEPHDHYSSRLHDRHDALYMADQAEENRQRALDGLGASWQEHVAGEPSYDFLEPAEQDRMRADWFEKSRREFGMPESEIAELRRMEELDSSIERHRERGGMEAAVGMASLSGPEGLARFDEARLDIATSDGTDGYRPFERANPHEMKGAELDVGSAIYKIAYDDPTIAVDEGLRRSILLLNASGMEVGGERLDALERAYVRVNVMEAREGILSDNAKARAIAFDVAVQEEARGMVMSGSGGILNVARGAAVEKPARELVESMGIRTVQQEGPPMEDLKAIAGGRFEDVSEYHRAGLALGMSWAAAPDMPILDARIGRLSTSDRNGHVGRPSGIVGEEEARRDFAVALDRAASRGSAPEQQVPVLSKGPESSTVDHAAFMAGRTGGKGR